MEAELAQKTAHNSTRTCSASPFHVCTAQTNYGFIQVDWAARTVQMGIRTPEEHQQVSHTIAY